MGKRLRRDRLRRMRLLRAQGKCPKVVTLCAHDVKIEASLGDAQKGPRRVTMLAYNGGALRLPGWKFPWVIELSGMETSQRPKIFLEHDHGRRVGHIDSVSTSERTITASGLISASGPDAQAVLADADAGYPWEVSVGVKPLAAEWVPQGKSIQANGQTFKGPLNVARRSQLYEISFVSIGADQGTQVSIAAGAKTGVDSMDFEKWLAAMGFAIDELSDAQKKSLQAKYDAEIEASGGDDDGDDDDDDQDPPPKKKKKKQPKALRAGGGDPLEDDDDEDADDPMASIKAGMRAESKRLAMIEIKAKDFPEIRAKAIDEDWDEDKVELEVLRASRPRLPAIHSGRHATDLGGRPLEASLCRSAGISAKVLEAAYDEKVLEAADRREYRCAGLQSLLHEVIRAAGMYYRAGLVDHDFIRTAFEADRKLQASGASFSTYSLSGILSNVGNKGLLQSFLAVKAVAPLCAATRFVNDFKGVTNYRMTATGAFQPVPASGELKHLALDEDAFTNQADTWGGILGIARKDWINDDLGAFMQLPKYFGRQGAIFREKLFFTILLSNPGAFFAVGNKNLISGGGSALSIAGLTLGEQTFADQTDKNADPILVAPAILLTGTALSVTADQLMTETRVNETTTANAAKPANNPHAGKWKPLSSAYVNSQGLSGSSATKWWLLANPEDVAAFQFVYLQGRDTPIIESGQPNFDTLGIQMRSYYDIGCKEQDFRGAVQSNGV